MHVSGPSYEANDHEALANDLELITRLGFRVCPLSSVVDALESGNLDSVVNRVAITLDDGSDFDFHDLPHPTWGKQRSMLSILKDAAAKSRMAAIEATSFAIVSPKARAELDQRVMIGHGWWRDTWWSDAEASGFLRIESHSWDHNHECLSNSVANAVRGSFDLTSSRDADAEIRDANEYLCAGRHRTGPVLFAYPYGLANDFLSRDYFPRGTAAHGIRAAFTTDGAPISFGVDRWKLPRFVFGWHWKSPEGLETILRECG